MPINLEPNMHAMRAIPRSPLGIRQAVLVRSAMSLRAPGEGVRDGSRAWNSVKRVGRIIALYAKMVEFQTMLWGIALQWYIKFIQTNRQGATKFKDIKEIISESA